MVGEENEDYLVTTDEFGNDYPTPYLNWDERLDFAFMIHPHLDHTTFITFTEAEQREWKADVIVEIAECSERLEFSRHDDGSEILGGSFAVTASEADD